MVRVFSFLCLSSNERIFSLPYLSFFFCAMAFVAAQARANQFASMNNCNQFQGGQNFGNFGFGGGGNALGFNGMNQNTFQNRVMQQASMTNGAPFQPFSRAPPVKVWPSSVADCRSPVEGEQVKMAQDENLDLVHLGFTGLADGVVDGLRNGRLWLLFVEGNDSRGVNWTRMSSLCPLVDFEASDESWGKWIAGVQKLSEECGFKGRQVVAGAPKRNAASSSSSDGADPQMKLLVDMMRKMMQSVESSKPEEPDHKIPRRNE